MIDMLGIEYLRNKLSLVRSKVLRKYEFYDQENAHRTRTVVIPGELSAVYAGKLDWCTNAVDTLADSLSVLGFGYDPVLMNDIYNKNNFDVLFESAFLGAIISGCDFLYIHTIGSDGEIPRIQVIDGSNATGRIDPVTMLLKEGYAVLDRDPKSGKPTLEAYFEPYKTTYYYSNGKIESISHSVAHPLLVPIVYRPDSVHPFGRSRISRTCIKNQENAEDVLTRINVLSEVASWPQKYVLGLSEQAGEIDTFKATVSSMLRLDKDADGDKPTVGQFQQLNIQPHIETFKMYASNFAGETGLTMDDLGFVLSNPSSADAIKAAHEKLRKTARKAQRLFTTGIINCGYLAACLRNDENFDREEVIKTEVMWAPIVEPDAAMLSAIGDGAIKVNQAIPGYFDSRSLENLTGIRSAGGVTESGLFTDSSIFSE